MFGAFSSCLQRMRQLDGMVATLASGSKHLLSQHNLIPDLVDKLEIAARNRTRITEKEAEIICRQGSDLNVHRFILGDDLCACALVLLYDCRVQMTARAHPSASCRWLQLHGLTIDLLVTPFACSSWRPFACLSGG